MKKFAFLVLVSFASPVVFAQSMAQPSDVNAEARLTASLRATAGEPSPEKAKNPASVSTPQHYVFGDNKARIKVTVVRSNDSLALKVEFANQSGSSFYIDAEKPISYQWTPAGNELLIEYGADTRNESEFPVTLIKGGETKDLLITLPRKTNKFKMNLLVSYYESSSSTQLLSLRTKGKGRWNWSEYHVPVLLK
jgi:hypothetical protein